MSSDDLTFSIAVSKVSFASLRSRSLTEESCIPKTIRSRISDSLSTPNSQVLQCRHVVVDGLTTVLISREKNIAFIYSVLPGVAKRLELLQSLFNFEFVAFFIQCERVVNIDSFFADYSK